MFKEHWEIYYIDTDPDNGDEWYSTPIALALTKENADWIVDALSKDWMLEASDPNRIFVHRYVPVG